MKTCSFTQSGIDVDVSMVRDNKSGHWLVMARWSMSCEGRAMRTMPPQDPNMTEEEAWDEARAWASRRLTCEMLEAGGIASPTLPTPFKGYSLSHDYLQPNPLQLALKRQRERIDRAE